MRRVNSRVPGGCDNHGTHCAGTVAASTFGVAKEALVVSVGVLDCAGDGTVSSIIAGSYFTFTAVPHESRKDLYTAFVLPTYLAEHTN